ncbi:uroporphyrinogen-III synthase [Rhodomicrobium vannielii ATCC 17100]|uniref:uroporphyrinogen-III synthase n=1 Tax=Rhodomicrobium vannielii TaxID=1069 RepID=UPI00191956E0|nr:uroporphyrinogen-III synthase [Rhodomicrobium vannielii]MBJ7534960.1 uroporphyrinogen-III synthase [Rhodomicrobium vannielii ATCC 17100]
MRLLVTRAEQDAAPFAGELRELGHEPVLQPLIELRALDFDAAELENTDALIITSGNTLRALEQAGAIGGLARFPIYCVGDATARRARHCGLQKPLTVADTGEQLAAAIIAMAAPGTRFVHVAGEHLSFDIVGELTRHGMPSRSLAVYVMQAAEAFKPDIADMIEQGTLDGVTLLSPRTAEIYVSLCHRHRLAECAKKLSYFCISETVAQQLRTLEPRGVYISERPNRKALLDLVR